MFWPTFRVHGLDENIAFETSDGSREISPNSRENFAPFVDSTKISLYLHAGNVPKLFLTSPDRQAQRAKETLGDISPKGD